MKPLGSNRRMAEAHTVAIVEDVLREDDGGEAVVRLRVVKDRLGRLSEPGAVVVWDTAYTTHPGDNAGDGDAAR